MSLCGYGGLCLATPCVPVPEPMATTRFPIVFKTPSWLGGASVHGVEAWRYVKKAWSQVSIQVDEVNTEGNYVLEEGIPYTKFTDDGFLDDNDELSVEGSSLGGQFSRKTVAKEIAARFTRFQRVDFCSDGEKYLGSLLIGQSISRAEVPKYTPLYFHDSNEVRTSRYRYSFRANQPMLIGDVLLKTPAGEKPVFAGSSFVMPLIPRIFVFPSLYFGENDFTSEIECWRSGPVRSIVAVGAKLRKFFSLIDLHLFSELVFYDDYFQIPTKIEFIFNPSDYLARGSGLAYVLKYPEGVDWAVSSNLADLPATGPESGAIKETAFEKSKNGIFTVRGSSDLGSFIANIRVDQKALKQAPPPYVASRESFSRKEMREAWPWLKKSSGSLGVFIEISGVQRGMYDFALDVGLSNQAHDDFTDFQAVSANWPDPAAY
jgi:hypothetical protein